ncbi:MAG: ferritin-like domain-containing protein [Gammaproteobacteria bacterium]
MKQQGTETGMNRTGIGMAPRLRDDMIEGAQQGAPSSQSNGQAIAQVRHEYAADAPGVGSVPPPASLKGVVQEGMQAVMGHKPSVFVNKLGERLAFERTSTRLYEALLAKFNGQADWEGGPSRAELERFHQEELQHFEMIREAIESLGGDPTVVTPAADVAGVASEGLLKVVTDPRTSIAQSLEALLVAELADNDGWKMLIQLANAVGEKELAKRFRTAAKEEDQHLAAVRQWLSSGVESEAKREGPKQPRQTRRK